MITHIIVKPLFVVVEIRIKGNQKATWRKSRSIPRLLFAGLSNLRLSHRLDHVTIIEGPIGPKSQTDGNNIVLSESDRQKREG